VVYYRLDTWECDQPQWVETAKVCAHHKSKLENDCQSTNPAPTKKRRKDLRNERVNEGNYIKVLINFIY